VVTKQAAFGAPTAGEEYSARGVGLSVLELLLDAAQMPTVAASQGDGATGSVTDIVRSTFAVIIERTEADCTVQ